MSTTTTLCPLCKHIYWTNEPHECPSAEYIAARDALVRAAAEAEELFTQEELEGHGLVRRLV